MELSPGGFRTFIVGTTYQLGNLVSSASSTVEAKMGEQFPLPSDGETQRYQYGKVICIFMACVYGYNILMTVLGPERLGQEFGLNDDDIVKETDGAAAQDDYTMADEEKGGSTAVMAEAK